MAAIISVFNQGGGTGKTSVSLNLGYELSKLNYRVLLVDFDPQASLTLFLGEEPVDLEREEMIYISLMDEAPLPIRHTHDLSWVPSNIYLSQAEIELVSADMRDFRLKDALEPIQEEYDVIVIDCPPSLGILSYLALVSSTHVVIPVIPEFKYIKGVQLFLNTYKRVRRRPNPELKIGAFLPWAYDQRTKQARDSLEVIQTELSQYAPVLTPMKKSVIFSDASQFGVPLSIYKPSHPCAVLMQKITNEFAQAML